MYGTGLYGTYKLDSQLTDSMRNAYGRYILKGKLSLDNFVILDVDVYQKTNNTKKFGKYLEELGVDIESINEYTSDIAHARWKEWKREGYAGIIFTGRRDGHVAVIWNRRNFIPASYSVDDGKSWVKLSPNIRNIKRANSSDDYKDPQSHKFITPELKHKIKRGVKHEDGTIVGLDDRNNQIYFKDSRGIEWWKEYDKNNNKIHYKDSSGDEWWAEYDKNNNPIYYKDSDGDEWWKAYDENNNRIYYKNSRGDEWWKEYDKNNNQIYYKNSRGDEWWKEYDKNNNLIYYKPSGGVDYYNAMGEKIPNPNIKTESFKTFFESMNSNDIDLNKAYDIFNKEYMKSTGKSWSKDKFMGRARSWTFYGDENGYIAVRPQRSGFIKLVGAAGSDKSKFKGFKELIAENTPVWGMVDDKISTLLTKLGFRGPNMIERIVFNKLIQSDQFKGVLGGAEIIDIKGSAVTLRYPDIGVVTKYFMGSPSYWSKLKTSIPLNKLNPFKKI
jgi:hypothetical protein